MNTHTPSRQQPFSTDLGESHIRTGRALAGGILKQSPNQFSVTQRYALSSSTRW